MKRNLNRILLVSCVMCIALLPVLGQETRTKRPGPQPARGSNATVLVVAPTEVAKGETFTVELQVELGTTKFEDGTATALGGYVLPIGFDPSIVKFISADGGETPAFNKAPTFTNADMANEKGVVIATAFTTAIHQPMTSLSVAKLTFVAEKTGAAVFTVDPQGSPQHAALASVLHNDASVAIPASYKNGAVTVSSRKTTSRPIVKGKSNPSR
ncbi:MAG TPA: cohesin domain-containing protein [Blastocatellia bacterium]|nr:cohesin domain-containing protein [Blastocatellia bacterium]